jgi:hypothetical protein
MAACAAAGNTWRTEPAWGIVAPECLQSPNLRDNADDGEVVTWNWKIPSELVNAGSCVLRVRYNVSSDEYNGWAHVDQAGGQMIDSSRNGVGLLKGNPIISLGVNASVSLNVDTSQYGRTFQDRSHTFKVVGRPASILANSKIWNLNVRGRRGNKLQFVHSHAFFFFLLC